MMPKSPAATLLALSLCAPIAPAVDLRDDVFYQIMPIAWRDSNNDAWRYGDFGGLASAASLDYLQDLGVTALWLNPVWPSPAYHGYFHGRVDQVNSWFGTEADFTAFLTAANARNIRVHVDIAAHSVNRDNAPYFPSAFANPLSPYDTWLTFTNALNTQWFQAFGDFNTWSGAPVRSISWDYRTQAARDTMNAWCTKWMDPNNDGNLADGLAGYRLDHTWVYYQNTGAWGYNLHDFWIPWKASLQSVNPNAVSFPEQADWGSYGNEFFPAHDAAFTMPFQFAARDAIANEQAANLYSSMATTWAMRGVRTDRTFLCNINNHDNNRLASAIGATTTATLGKARAAAAVHILQPLTPVIYYGDELAMLGTKGNFGSDANDIPLREPFKWLAVAGPPMSNYHAQNAGAYNGRFALNNDGRSVPEQQGVAGSVLETYRSLITLRRNNPALRRGGYDPVPAASTRVWSFVRHLTGDDQNPAQTLLVAINLRSTTQNTTLNLSNFTLPAGGSSTVTDIVTGATLTSITAANRAAYPLSITPYSYRVLAVSITPPTPTPIRADGIDIPTSLGAPGAGPGALAATQTNPTSFGDHRTELDQLFLRAGGAEGGLTLGVTGNLTGDATAIALLIDSVEGGHNVLELTGIGSPPGGLEALDGTRLDAGFSADRLLFLNSVNGILYADWVTLPTGATGVKQFLGYNGVNGWSGVLTGGQAVSGVQVALDHSNIAGVTAASAAGAATAVTGMEIFLPYAALGMEASPPGCARIGVQILALESDGSVGNQVLPPLPAGASALGTAPDFVNAAGAQHTLTLADAPDDFNNDGIYPDITDLLDFLSVFAAGPCSTPACDSIDFNADGIYPDSTDLDLFLNVFAGGSCPA